MNKRIWVLIIAIVLAIGVFGGCDSQTKCNVSFVQNTPSGVQGKVENFPGGIANVEKGSTIIKPAQDPTLANYKFDGWYKESACVNAWNFDTDTVDAKNTRLFAKWTHVSELKCDVEFMANLSFAGEKIVQDHFVTNMPDKIEGAAKNTTLASPQKIPYIYRKDDPTKTKVSDVVVFDGWHTESGCQTKFLFGETQLSGNLSLYARWKLAGDYEPVYTVRFDANVPEGVEDAVGDMPADIEDIPDGATILEPLEIPSLEGYVFDGWYIDKDGQTAWDFDEDTVTINKTLYAKWMPAEYVPVDNDLL